MKRMKKAVSLATVLAIAALLCLPAFAAGGVGDVTTAITGTWSTAKTEIKTVVNDVIFPVLDLVLVVLLFIKGGGAYFDYKKHGQFEWAPLGIIFGCLIFALTAPTYIWTILGM